MRTALLLIDIQNDYFPGGENELAGPFEAGLMAEHLLEAFRERKMPVVHVQHIATRPDATCFLPGTPGAAINDIVRPRAGEVVVQKSYPNAFRNTELLPTLARMGVRRLVIGGMMTHMCVDSTVRAASDHGFDCIVAHDACATKDMVLNDGKKGSVIPAPQVHRAFLGALNGTFATVMSTDQVLQAITGYDEP